MEGSGSKREMVQQLRQEMLSLQGLRAVAPHQKVHTGLGILENAFPDQAFPVAAVHEFISPQQEDAAATSGFMAGLLGHLMKGKGECIWIGTRRTLFPPALKAFGIEPHRVIFIDLQKEKEVLWTIEEALKCNALTAVVGELSDINLTESRRLQLAVESSRVTGFLHRYQPRKIENTACVSRWHISSIKSELEPGMPGVGLPRWNVSLIRIRNGKPGQWQLEWTGSTFRNFFANTAANSDYNIKTG